MPPSSPIRRSFSRAGKVPHKSVCACVSHSRFKVWRAAATWPCTQDWPRAWWWSCFSSSLSPCIEGARASTASMSSTPPPSLVASSPSVSRPLVKVSQALQRVESSHPKRLIWPLKTTFEYVSFGSSQLKLKKNQIELSIMTEFISGKKMLLLCQFLKSCLKWLGTGGVYFPSAVSHRRAIKAAVWGALLLSIFIQSALHLHFFFFVLHWVSFYQFMLAVSPAPSAHSIPHNEP